MEHFGSQRYEKENPQHMHVPVLSDIVSWMRGPPPSASHPQTPNPSAAVSLAASIPLPQSRNISRANSSNNIAAMGQSPLPTSYMSMNLPSRSPSQSGQLPMPRARSSSAVNELPSNSPSGTPAMTPVGSPNPGALNARSHISLSPSLFGLMGPPPAHHHNHHHPHRPVAFKL